MAAPRITGLKPVEGPASGGDLVRITGTDFGTAVEVCFGGAPAQVVALRNETDGSLADVHAPAHSDGSVAVTVRNIDGRGVPIPGE